MVWLKQKHWFQVNSNVMLKARGGTDKVSAAVVLKSWWNPSFTFAACAGFDLKRRWPSFGVMLNVDTDSELRYERGKQPQAVGSLVRQRHVANQDERDVGSGYRPIVQDDDSDPPLSPSQATQDALDRASRLM